MQGQPATIVQGNLVPARAESGRRRITPRGGVGEGFSIRPATSDDLPWIDALQKRHSKQLGFLPRMALEGKLKKGEILVAEGDVGISDSGLGVGPEQIGSRALNPNAKLPIPNFSPLGYLIAADRYFKRDEVGYVTQLCVVPEARRSLVAGALLQAQFERSAYGCKLYSCWCPQDLQANRFWAAMGFVPIAFRTGGRGRKGEGRRMKDEPEPEPGPPPSASGSSFLLQPSSFRGRIHIFWQKRIREADETTPWWFPSQTGGGALREDRIVFPIPPGVHWRDVLPTVLPEGIGEVGAGSGAKSEPEEIGAVVKSRAEYAAKLEVWEAEMRTWEAKKAAYDAVMEEGRERAHRGMMWFAPEPLPAAPVKPKLPAKLKPKQKAIVDRRLVAMARELRDRWMERPDLVRPALPRHDVRRAIEAKEPPSLRLAA